MTEIFSRNSLKKLKFWKLFCILFEFLCATEMTEIIWPKDNYFSVYRNNWNSMNFNEIPLKIISMYSQGNGAKFTVQFELATIHMEICIFNSWALSWV
jgi:hypothetical protein